MHSRLESHQEPGTAPSFQVNVQGWEGDLRDVKEYLQNILMWLWKMRNLLYPAGAILPIFYFFYLK